MSPSEISNVQTKLVSLERRLRSAERALMVNKLGWIALIALAFLVLRTKSFGVVQAQSEKLRLRELDIVDQKREGSAL